MHEKQFGITGEMFLQPLCVYAQKIPNILALCTATFRAALTPEVSYS